MQLGTSSHRQSWSNKHRTSTRLRSLVEATKPRIHTTGMIPLPTIVWAPTMPPTSEQWTAAHNGCHSISVISSLLCTTHEEQQSELYWAASKGCFSVMKYMQWSFSHNTQISLKKISIVRYRWGYNCRTQVQVLCNCLVSVIHFRNCCDRDMDYSKPEGIT